MSRLSRRQFLKTTGTFVASAAVLSKLPACGGDDDGGGGGGDGPGTFAFPQGVASGDPRPASVVLWTRAERQLGTGATIPLLVEVATDAAFSAIVVSKMIEATEASDHTVRVIVTDLSPRTDYHYRFTAGVDTITGRTRTAPEADADVPVNLAWVNCQDFQPGSYAAYRQLLMDDESGTRPVEFVVHAGDFIYESVGEPFQQAIDADFQPITLKNADGSDRLLPPLPSANSFAQDLTDYRHLYRSYLADPNLRAARARWPFINTWDDHEFADDCWQTQTNQDDALTLDEPHQARKVAAGQAWFEYVPSHLTGADGVEGVPSQAKDFTPVTVSDAPFTAPNEDNAIAEPNNLAALGAITLYRSLRFGRHVELVMTDLRSYRSDHAIPEELTQGQAQFFVERYVLPVQMVNTMDAGKTANGGAPPDEVMGYPNTRKDSPRGTMLGAAQRGWLKETLKRSSATWKLWVNPVMLMRMMVRKEGFELLMSDRIVSGDAWDGYPGERRELLTFIKDEGIKNVVSLSGDLHAHFGGLLQDDYDAPAASRTVVGAEIVAAGISSNTLLSFYEGETRSGVPAVLRKVVLFDTPEKKHIENLNLLLLKGTKAAVTYADTKDLQMALANDDGANAHLHYADTNAKGFGHLAITAESTTATLVTIQAPISGDTPVVKRTAKFVIPRDNPAGMTGPEFTGEKPVPFEA